MNFKIVILIVMLIVLVVISGCINFDIEYVAPGDTQYSNFSDGFMTMEYPNWKNMLTENVTGLLIYLQNMDPSGACIFGLSSANATLYNITNSSQVINETALMNDNVTIIERSETENETVLNMEMMLNIPEAVGFHYNVKSLLCRDMIYSVMITCTATNYADYEAIANRVINSSHCL